MTMTMEQQRAADAWNCCAGKDKDYTNLAKGVPALIMNSGLMQTLAFLEDKAGKQRNRAHRELSGQLRAWLAGRFPGVFSSDAYAPFMEALFKSDPREFQDVTAEAMAWLRWVRQLAPARETGEVQA